MKPFVVPEMTFKGHQQCHPLYFTWTFCQTGKLGYTYFQTKYTAEITSKVNQGHWQRHNSQATITF